MAIARRILLSLLMFAPFVAVPAAAQQSTVVAACGDRAWTAGQQRPPTLSTTGKLCVDATINASVGGFHAESSLTPVTVTTGGNNSGAFTAGKSVLVSNVGATNPMYCIPGPGATTSGVPVLPGQTVQITTASETVISCISTGGSTTANYQVGTGLATGWGGSGSGGGGGGGTSSTFGAAFPAAGTAIGVLDASGVTMSHLQVGSAGTAASTVLTIQGSAVDDAAASGNPVPVGGIFRTTLPTYTNADRTQLQQGLRGSLLVQLMASDGTTGTGVAAWSTADGATLASNIGPFALSQQWIYNGSTADRVRSVVNTMNTTGTGVTAVGPLYQFDSAAITACTENQFCPPRISASRMSMGIIADGAGNERWASVDSSNRLTIDVAGINGVTPLMGNGATGTGSHRVTIADNNTLPTGWASLSGQQAISTAITNLTGTKAPGTAAANSLLGGGVYTSAGVTLTNGQQAALQMTAAGRLMVEGQGVAQGSTTSGQTISPVGAAVLSALPTYTTAQTSPLTMGLEGGLFTSPIASPIGGATTHFVIAANSNNSTSLKGSAGTVSEISLSGIGSAPAYLKLYDKATAPTCGTDTPVRSYMIPANSTAANGGGNNPTLPAAGLKFTLGIGYCVVTGLPNSDNTSVAAATYNINIAYK